MARGTEEKDGGGEGKDEEEKGSPPGMHLGLGLGYVVHEA